MDGQQPPPENTGTDREVDLRSRGLVISGVMEYSSSSHGVLLFKNAVICEPTGCVQADPVGLLCRFLFFGFRFFLSISTTFF